MANIGADVIRVGRTARERQAPPRSLWGIYTVRNDPVLPRRPRRDQDPADK